jgi:hypothetical protein
MNRMILLPVLVLGCAAGAYVATSQSSSDAEMSRCVDYTDHVVASTFCSVNPRPMLVHGTLHPQPMYRNYYGGFGSYEVGSRAWGGSDYALRGHLYQTSATLDAPPQNLDLSPQPYTASGGR